MRLRGGACNSIAPQPTPGDGPHGDDPDAQRPDRPGAGQAACGGAAVKALAAVLPAALALLCTAASAAATSVAATLCRAGETVVFDCPIAHGKRASACASAALTAAAGTLQFRLGSLSKAELQWPAAPAENWRDRVKAGQVMYAGGGGAYLRFAAPPLEYVVYSALGRGWGHKAGVMVLQDGQPKSVLRCRAPATGTMGPALARRAGLPEDGQELELPPP